MRADTIYALASAPGRAGVAVVRLSGPDTSRALKSLGVSPPPAPRQAALARLRDPLSGAEIDRGLCLWFPAPASFTGEDVAELHVHGGRAVVAATLVALGGPCGLRAAEPGEFTRRAFENGKLDLTAAEGLADLVAAETEAQRRQALRQLDGALERVYEGWRARLVRLLAHLEATIDFPDEDLPEGVGDFAAPEIGALRAEIAAHLDDGRRGEMLRDGVHVVIVGPPNVGKSSILNRLARRDAAIVSPVPGTTRDIVEVRLDLGGYPVVIADTAGLRETAEPVEAEGVRRARVRAAAADLRLVVADATRIEWPAVGGEGQEIRIVNKVDLVPGTEDLAGEAVGVSAATGEGFERLEARLAEAAAACAGLSEGASLTRARHRGALLDCVTALDRAAGAAAELRAEDVRLAARALGRITGRVGVEDVLDAVFREFCIGK